MSWFFRLLHVRYKRTARPSSLQTSTIVQFFLEAERKYSWKFWLPLSAPSPRFTSLRCGLSTAIGAMLASSLPRIKHPKLKINHPKLTVNNYQLTIKTQPLKKLILFLLVLFTLQSTAQSQTIKVTASLEDTIYMIGQHIPVNLSVERNANVEVIWPFLVDSLGSFEVLKSGKIDTVITDNKSIEQQQIFITHFDTGYHVIPPVEFEYIEKRRTKTAKTEPFIIRMNTLEVDTAAAIMPIKNVIKMPLTFKEKLQRALMIAGVVLAILAIPAFIYFYLKRRKKQAYVPPPLPPYEMAVKRLRELKEKKLWQEGQIKEYYSELTDILRGYIEGRFELPALEMTTDEISPLLKKKKEVTKGLFRNVIDLLTISDFVKFAKARPSTKYHGDAFDQVTDFVRSTKPIVIEEEVNE